MVEPSCPPAALMRRPYWFCSPNCRPEVDEALHRALVVEAGADRSDRRAARALGHEVDHAGRRGEAVVERRGALEHLDALLVLHRDLGHVGDRERAVEPEVGAVLDRDAADHELVEGVAAVLLARDAGRVAQHVVDAGRALQLDDLARHRVDGGRHVHDAGPAEGAGLDGVGDEAAAALGLHGHRAELAAGSGGGRGGLRAGELGRQRERHRNEELVHGIAGPTGRARATVFVSRRGTRDCRRSNESYSHFLASATSAAAARSPSSPDSRGPTRRPLPSSSSLRPSQ